MGTRHCWIRLPVFRPRNVYKCREMYTNVYVCRANSRFFGTLFWVLPNSSSPSLMYSERTNWGHFTAFQLTAFAFEFSLGGSSGFSVRAPRMSTMWAPPRVLFRFRQPFEALFEFDAIILGQVDLSRPKSTQVDASRRKSTGFLFFWTIFLISQTVPPADSGSLTRCVPIRCNCLGLGRVATDYVGVLPFFRPLHA